MPRSASQHIPQSVVKGLWDGMILLACLKSQLISCIYKIWNEAGCPKSGVLSQIKKTTKSRYKYWVRRLKRRQNILLQKKLALLFRRKSKKGFWSEVRRLNQSHSSYTPFVDGVSGDENIANLFATKSEGLLTPTLPSLILLFTHLSSHLSQTCVLVRCLFQMMMYFRLFLNSARINQMEVVFGQNI